MPATLSKPQTTTPKFLRKGIDRTALAIDHFLPKFFALFNTADEGERYRMLARFVNTVQCWQDLYEVNTRANFNHLMNLFKKYKIDTSEVPSIVRERKFRKRRDRQNEYDSKYQIEEQMLRVQNGIRSALGPTIADASGALAGAVSDGFYEGAMRVQASLAEALRDIKKSVLRSLHLDSPLVGKLTTIFKFLNKVVILVLAVRTNNHLALYSILSDHCVSLLRLCVSPENATIETQGTGPIDRLKEWLSEALDEVCDLLTLPRIFKNVTGFMTGLLQMMDAGTKIKDVVAGLLDTFFNWLSHLTHDLGWTDLWYVSTYQKFKDLTATYDRLRTCRTLKTDLIAGKKSICFEVIAFDDGLKALLPKLGKRNPSQLVALNTMVRDAAEWAKMVPPTLFAEYKPRMEPFWINIFGRPGVGKTQTIKPRVMALVHAAATDMKLIDRPLNQEIFNFNPAEPFWDAYAGQRIFETTDLGQTMGDERANFTLIDAITHIVESSEYRPPVADLTKKGNVEPRPVAWITDSQQALSSFTHLNAATMSGGSHMLRRVAYEIEVNFNAGCDHKTDEEERWRLTVKAPKFVKGMVSGQTVTMEQKIVFSQMSHFVKWIYNEARRYYQTRAQEKAQREEELLKWVQFARENADPIETQGGPKFSDPNFIRNEIDRMIAQYEAEQQNSSVEEEEEAYETASIFSEDDTVESVVQEIEKNTTAQKIDDLLTYLNRRRIQLAHFMARLTETTRLKVMEHMPGLANFIEQHCPSYLTWRNALLTLGGVILLVWGGIKLARGLGFMGKETDIEKDAELDCQSGPKENQKEKGVRRPLVVPQSEVSLVDCESGPKENQKEKSVRRPLAMQSGPKEGQKEKSVRRPLKVESGPKENQREHNVRRPLVGREIVTQGGDFVYELQKFRNSIRNNFHRISVLSAGAISTSMWTMQVRPGLFVVPAHCWDEIVKGDMVHIVTRGMVNKIPTCEIRGWKPSDKRDLCFLSIRGMPSAGDITSYLPHRDTAVSDQFIHVIFEERQDYYSVTRDFHVTGVVNQRIMFPGANGYNYSEGLSVGVTAQGDCTTPYITEVDNRFYICAIHTAAFTQNKKRVLYAYLFQEDVADAVKLLPTEPNNLPSKFVTQGTDDELEELGLMVTGKLADLPDRPSPRVVAPNTTKFVPSPLADVLKEAGYKTEYVRAPAHLKPFKTASGERISPAKLSLKKLTNTTARMEDGLFDPITRYMERYYSSFRSSFENHKRVLTVDEAIRGIPGLIDSFRLKTSPGYPYMLNTAGKGKRRWIEFDKDGEPVSIAPELRERIEYLIGLMENKQYERIVVVDTLKDELLPQEKVDAGKVRIFQVLPMEINIIGRMYFLPFYNHLKENCKEQPVSTGLDPKSLDWDYLIRRLARVNSRALDPEVEAWIAGDYKNYDSTLHRRVGENHACVANYWYQGDEKAANVRTTLMAAIFSCAHCFGDTIFENVQGNPSGEFGTTQVNSTGNHMLFLYSYCDRFGIQALEPDNEFYPTRNIELATVGDDNLCCVSQRAIAGGFNALQHAVGLKKIGLTYTSTDKTDNIRPLLKLPDVTFLKRDFFFHPQLRRYIGRLDLSTASTIGMWTDKSNIAIADIYRAHIKDLYEELALWDGPHFASLRAALPKAQKIFESGRVCLGQQCLAYHRHTQECVNCHLELDEHSHIKGQPCASLHTIDLAPPTETSFEVVRRLYRPKDDNPTSDGCFVLHAGGTE